MSNLKWNELFGIIKEMSPEDGEGPACVRGAEGYFTIGVDSVVHDPGVATYMLLNDNVAEEAIAERDAAADLAREALDIVSAAIELEEEDSDEKISNPNLDVCVAALHTIRSMCPSLKDLE